MLKKQIKENLKKKMKSHVYVLEDNIENDANSTQVDLNV